MKIFAPIFPPEDDRTGIYLHVPFCRSRCRYCGFVTDIHKLDHERQYFQSVIREIALWRERIAEDEFSVSEKVDTLYFGGGTPSLLQAEHLIGLLDACQTHFRVMDDAEVTLEINPATADRSALRVLREAGFNRASLGIQSLLDSELQFMGRSHSARDALAAFEDLRAARFDNVSVDLIAGFPGQTRQSLGRTLHGVTDLQPEHVSAYLLEVKTGTGLDQDIRAGKIPSPDEDLAADLYEDICSRLSRAGYDQYEISNFARNNRQSRHNLKYWQDQVFLGFGPGAHGMTGRHRYANLEDLASYSLSIAQDQLPLGSMNPLTPETRFKDALIMGLRLVSGVDLSCLGCRYQVDARPFVIHTIGDLIEAGLVSLREERLALRARGRLLSNVVFSRWV